jgi:S1-C subfamily serine protease
MTSKTVALVTFDEDGDTRAFCSGVWVGYSTILTANHCVESGELPAFSGQSFDYVTRNDVYKAGSNDRRDFVLGRVAKLFAQDEVHDLALLSVQDAPGHEFATLTTADIVPGSFAQAMGHSLGLWWSYSSGDIAAVRRLELPAEGTDLVWIQADVPISPGNSGGGLFDIDGNLIGIAHGTFANPRAQLLNIFVHRDYIAGFLRSA